MTILLVRLVIILFVVYGVWRIFHPKPSVRIIIRNYAIKKLDGLAKKHEHDVLRFFENDLEFDGKLDIRASRSSDGYLRTDFSGRIEQGTRQQIRNFLNTIM